MIIFSVYLILLCFLIYKNNFFGILRDDTLNSKFLLTAFLVKLSGLFVFYIVYTKLYGTVFYSDTDHYFKDSKILNNVAHWDFKEYIKLMLGWQDESENSALFQQFLKHTTVWDAKTDELFYNDNRLLLRLNSLIHFISNANYYVHALLSCFLSFIGIVWLYKAFKFLFQGKEILLIACWLLFPGLWFWSSSLLKEGVALFVMGVLFVSLKRIIGDKHYSLKNCTLLMFSLVLVFCFKQYTLMPLLALTFVFFVIYFRFKNLKHPTLVYILSCVFLLAGLNTTLKVIKNKNLIDVLADRQQIFVDLSNGGIFLLDSTKFIRLPYDTTLISNKNSNQHSKTLVSVKAGASYSYCELSHQKDTLICESNKDTVSLYEVLYVIDKADAPISVIPLKNNFLSISQSIPQALWITCTKPFFVGARNVMDILASLENLIICSSFLCIVFAFCFFKKRRVWLVYLLSLVIVVLIIIGVTSPNIGAIERYRVLVIPFLLMAVLLALPVNDPFFLRKMFKKQDKS